MIIRNAQIIDTAHESWVTATMVNRTGETLYHPAATFIIDDQQIVVTGPALESGAAWRIHHQLNNRPHKLVDAYATYETATLAAKEKP